MDNINVVMCSVTGNGQSVAHVEGFLEYVLYIYDMGEGYRTPDVSPLISRGGCIEREAYDLARVHGLPDLWAGSRFDYLAD